MKSKLQALHTRLAASHSRLFLSSLIGFLFLGLAAAGLQSSWAMLAADRHIILVDDSSVKTQAVKSQADPTQPQVGPGIPQGGSNAPRSAASSLKPGSLLFFPKFASDASKPNDVNTLLTVTNANPRDAVTVRVFFVHDCAVEDLFLTLVANQSRTLIASKDFPGKSGYVIALAVNSQGLPTQFNWLLGNASLRDAAGHEASYNAFAVAKRSAGPARYNDGYFSAEVIFNNADYDRLPKRAAIDNLQNQDPASGPSFKTDVAVFSPMKDLTGETASAVKLTATLRDSAGTGVSQQVNTNCGLDAGVEQIWAAPPFNSIIAANRPGWATFEAENGDGTSLPVLGLSLTDGTSAALHNARVMQTLEWLESFSITVPVRQAENPVSDVVTQEQPDATGGAPGASEIKAGSILFYPRFVSGSFGNTQIYLTNTHPAQKARLRVFASGLSDQAQVKETILTLPALQTVTLQADDLLPNQRGWLMVMVIDGRALPIQFNYLIGSAQVNDAGGQKSSFNAMAVAKNNPDAVNRNDDVQTADLLFDDENYDRLPATTGMSFVWSQVDNSTSLGFSRPAASLLEPPNTRGAATATLYDELLLAFSANVPRTETKLNQIKTSILAPAITNSLKTGQHGWLKLLSGTPVLSWSLNLATAAFNGGNGGNGGSTANAATWKGGLSAGGNLHILTTADTHTLKVPATNPDNHAPEALADTLDNVIEARRAGGTIVRFDGSNSSDPDEGDTLSYQWNDNELPVSTARIADRKLAIGSHSVSLVVTDASGIASAPAEQTVTVVDTTPPQISGVPSAISKVADSDAGDVIHFLLPAAYDMVDGNITVTASRPSGSVFPLGKTTVTFTARDKAGNTSAAKMDVSVTKGAPQAQTGGIPGDRAPLMDNLNDQYVKVGEARSLILQASDADNDPVTFVVQSAPSFVQIISGDPGSRNATLRIAPKAGDTVVAANVRIIASDGRGQTFSTLPFRIFISDVPNDDTGSGISLNHPPVAAVAHLPEIVPATSKGGADLTLDGSGSSDPDGDSLAYSWYDGDVLIARGKIADVKLAVGTHSIKLTVFDGKDGLTSSAPQSIEVTPRPLSIISAMPNAMVRSTTDVLMIVGTGFNAGSELRFSKEGIAVASYVSIEEDKIVVNVSIAANAIPGYRDVYVFNPTGTNFRLRSGLLVNVK
ncbi:MAG: HYR domain-containing protein [Acidobacteriota bacterium]